MTVALFVARDDDEFRKYRKWFAAQGIAERCELLVCPARSVSGESDSNNALKFGSRRKKCAIFSQERNLAVKPTRFVKKCSPSFIVAVTNKATLAVEKVKAPGNIYGVGDKIIEEFMGLVVDSAGKSEVPGGQRPLSIRTFIHWGGGNPFEFEGELAKKVDAYDFANVKLAGGWRIDDFKAFAVSSRRRGCLDVTGDMITLPDTKEKLEELIGRFTFDLVKDVMFRYVLENEGRREESAKEESAKEPAKESGKFEVDSVDGLLLQRYLSYMQKNWERWSGARMLIKLLLEQMKKTANELGKDCQLELNDQTAALFSYLLREGVRHG